MDLLSLVTENVAELLFKVIQFTKGRQKLLIKNIRSADEPGYEPRDLAVEEFCTTINTAIREHVENQRLLLLDTDNIKFEPDGGFEAEPLIDAEALAMLARDRQAYIKDQMAKLLENSLHQQMAAELLRSTEGIAVPTVANRTESI